MAVNALATNHACMVAELGLSALLESMTDNLTKERFKDFADKLAWKLVRFEKTSGGHINDEVKKAL